MADFTEIDQQIDDNIKPNGVNGITGAVLNGVLKAMIQAVADNLPQLYSENVEDEIAKIQTSNIQFRGERISLKNNGGTTSMDGGNLRFVTTNEDVIFEIGGTGFHVELQHLFILDFDVRNGFMVQLHDGNDPYVMKFDLLNGLQFGSVNIEMRLDDLQEKKADKVVGATAGNLVTLDSNGDVVDSGIPIANIQKRFVVDDIEQVDENLLTNALEVGDVLIVRTTMYQPKQAYVAVSQTVVGGKWVFASANENDITFVFYENNEYVNTVVVPIG